MKGTLLVEENTFTATSRLPWEGFFKSKSTTLNAYCQQTMSVCLQSANNERLFSEHSTFTATSRRKFQGISLNTTFNTPCALPTNGVSLLAPAKNERHFTGRTMYLHGNVLAFFREIMLELH